jgi:polyhydroxybutyrate depolymerase
VFGVGETELSLDVGRRPREVVLNVPPGLPAAPVALVVVFHGYGGTAADAARQTGLSAKGEAEGFVAVYPQGIGNEWHIAGYPSSAAFGDGDLQLFLAVLDRMAESGCVDMTRVYVTGHSQGGGMAALLACTYGDRVAAVALVSGEYLELPCEPARPMPVVAFHSREDPTLLYGGGHIPDTSSSFPDQLPAEAVAAEWARHNGCSAAREEEPAGPGITRLTWSGCQAPTVLYRLDTGSHDWPGSTFYGPGANQDISATDVIWDFFASVPEAAPRAARRP